MGIQQAATHYQDPTPEMLNDPLWNAIWSEIKTWDINVPSEYAGYCGATGNHVTAIYLALADHQEALAREVGRQKELIRNMLAVIECLDVYDRYEPVQAEARAMLKVGTPDAQ